MDEQKFTEMYELTKENNKMLKSIRRDAFVGGILKAIMWVVFLVVIPYLTWLYIEPYVEGVLETYRNVQDTTTAVSNTTSMDFSKVQEFFNQFGSKPN